MEGENEGEWRRKLMEKKSDDYDFMGGNHQDKWKTAT